MGRLIGKTGNAETYGGAIEYTIYKTIWQEILIAWFSGIITAISAIIIWVYLSL